MSNKRLANIPDGPNTRTTRPLAGRQFAALMDALCATFSFEEIRSLAREGLGIESDDIAAGVNRRQYVFELLVWCERGAHMQEFVAAALAAKPDATELAALAEQLGFAGNAGTPG